jgi:hypothetical protein
VSKSFVVPMPALLDLIRQVRPMPAMVSIRSPIEHPNDRHPGDAISTTRLLRLRSCTDLDVRAPCPAFKPDK